MQSGRWREMVAQRIERASFLDRLAAGAQGLGRKAVPEGPVKDVLRGTPLGHPLHPALVAVPIGAWASATLFDLLGDDAAARRLTAIGCMAALPAALAGGTDWLSTDGERRRVGLVHAVLNDAALTCYTLSWRARRRGARRRGLVLSLAGGGLLGAGGWLGGHLAYSLGVGVDTTSFLDRRARNDARHADAAANTSEPASPTDTG
jgi:uncharacterized membrane protein